MKREKEVTFWLTPKEMLNSNSLPRNTHLKGKMTKALRALAGAEGARLHSHEIESRLAVQLEHQKRELVQEKSRLTKTYNEGQQTDQAYSKGIESIDQALHETAQALAGDKDYLFDRYSVTVTIYGPTKRLFDPPNFYPTVKAMIDGLTDALWWEDDNFTHMQSMTFRYGGLSSQKGCYQVNLLVTDETNEARADSNLEPSAPILSTGASKMVAGDSI